MADLGKPLRPYLPLPSHVVRKRVPVRAERGGDFQNLPARAFARKENHNHGFLDPGKFEKKSVSSVYRDVWTTVTSVIDKTGRPGFGKRARPYRSPVFGSSTFPEIKKPKVSVS